MALTVISSKTKYIGRTADIKPTFATHNTLPGATFYDYDTGILYITHNGTDWVEKDTIVRLETSPTIDIGDVTLLAGTASIGKLGANSGVDIGDVDVTSIIPGVAATNLGKAEDAAHTSGDTGVMTLAVRRDVPTQEAGADGDYTPIHSDRLGRTRISPTSIFGKPYLRAEGTSNAKWEKTPDFGDMRDAPSGWRARLFGGTQSGNDWAAVEIPVDEMPITKLTSMQIMYEDEINETYGIGITIYVHDPNEHDSRAEISLYTSATGGHTPPDSAQGWNYYELSTASTGYFWYGNNCGSPGLTEGLPNIYTIAQFQADTVFQNYTIYRIEVFHGWAGAGECDDCWVGSIHINKEGIPLVPPIEELEFLPVRDTWLFGKPTLAANNNGRARWVRGETSPLDQKSATGWLANLYGGVQTGDDWARVNIPVNEMPVGELKSALWTYYMSAAETMGVNMVVIIHDPTDNDKRAEVTQLANVAGLEKGLGWNAHELSVTTDQFFWYGENCTGAGLAEGTGTLFGLDDLQADALFKNWTICRITIEYGWEASGTFDDAYVADIKLNGQVILLEPETGTHRKTVLVSKTVASAGAEGVDDVISEHITTGTDWDFDFGGTGYITKAMVVSAANAVTPRLTIFLYTAPPTCNPDDNVASDGPLVADMPYFVGQIDMPAMTDAGTGHSYAIATPSTYGNLPLMFDAPMLYGIVVTKDIVTFGQTLLYVSLSADMEDN